MIKPYCNKSAQCWCGNYVFLLLWTN